MSVGLALYGLMIMAFYPSIVDQQEELDEIVESGGDFYKIFLGENADNLSFADPGPYFGSQFGIWMVLILGAMVMIQAFNAITNAEREGTMDLLMSFPVSRREMFAARMLNTAASLLIILTVVFVTFVISREIWPEFEVSIGDLAAAIYGSFFILMAQAGFTYFLTAVIPSSRKFAGPVAYLLFFGSYLVYSLSLLNDTLTDIQPLLLFDYYDSGSIITSGWDMTNLVVLTVFAAVFSILGYVLIDRKELGV
jgi:ABC-type transport system involved in multi-copper enzyme maturation permease subunit